MLHNFEYEDAVDEFQKAQRIDPHFAMAYWGEAMAHNQPVWMAQNTRAAKMALLKLGTTQQERLKKAKTDREKDYIASAEVLFFSSDDKHQRDDDYRRAMQRLAKKYPRDVDAAALYALSILGTSHEGRDFAIYMQSAAVLESALKKAPRHPGLLHYLIHSYDDPVHAPLGLDAADLYSKIAPSSSHALHMPTHIYFSLGMWDKSSQLNERSLAASQARSRRKKIPLDVHGVHTLRWLPYGYLQQERFKDAQRTLKLAGDYYDQGEINTGTLLYLHSMYLLESEDWDRQLPNITVPGRVKISRNRFIANFTRGLQAIKTNKLNIAENMRALLEADLNEMRHHDIEASGNEVLLLELNALLALQAGEKDKSIELLEQATKVEDDMPFSYGPAWPTKPAHELFGEILHELRQVDEASKQFLLSLKRFPMRTLTLKRLLKTYIELKDDNNTREIRQKISRNLRAGD